MEAIMEIKLICEICGKRFFRKKGEVNRNRKLGRPTYCSLACAGIGNLGNIPVEKRHHPENLKPDNRGDEFSLVRFHLRNIKNKSRCRKPCYVDLQDLKEQWDKQEGRCPYTGWLLKTPINCGQLLPKTPDRASLDRIDSSKPYTKDNIQFISLMAQYAKNSWDGQELLDFCRAVAQNRG
jgi:hypothetical protein